MTVCLVWFNERFSDLTVKPSVEIFWHIWHVHKFLLIWTWLMIILTMHSSTSAIVFIPTSVKFLKLVQNSWTNQISSKFLLTHQQNSPDTCQLFINIFGDFEKKLSVFILTFLSLEPAFARWTKRIKRILLESPYICVDQSKKSTSQLAWEALGDQVLLNHFIEDRQSFNIKMLKSLALLLAFVAFVSADVVELGDADFDSTLEELDTALVMFYAPW